MKLLKYFKCLFLVFYNNNCYKILLYYYEFNYPDPNLNELVLLFDINRRTGWVNFLFGIEKKGFRLGFC